MPSCPRLAYTAQAKPAPFFSAGIRYIVYFSSYIDIRWQARAPAMSRHADAPSATPAIIRYRRHDGFRPLAARSFSTAAHASSRSHEISTSRQSALRFAIVSLPAVCRAHVRARCARCLPLLAVTRMSRHAPLFRRAQSARCLLLRRRERKR